MCFHYVSSYCQHDHYHLTCEYCVLWSNAHHYSCSASSHIRRSDNIRSAWCGSATKFDSQGHYKGLSWHHHYDAATASVPNAFSGICQIYHESSAGKFLFKSWASHQFLILCVGVCYRVCFLVSGSHVAAMFTNGNSTIGTCNTATVYDQWHSGQCCV